ncbi:hypothetical protein AAEX28_01510 [Lentisphaerota bacterium WC36G]|nr:hypothetical protein LJT99_04395 [Lentisphaerae bacterium WC36]
MSKNLNKKTLSVLLLGSSLLLNVKISNAGTLSEEGEQQLQKDWLFQADNKITKKQS